MTDFEKNNEKTEELSNTELGFVDDSNNLKKNKNPIDRDTPKYSPIKGLFQTADELVDEADIQADEDKIKAKLAKKNGLSSEELDDVLNYKAAEAPEKNDLEKLAEARINRANKYDEFGPESLEYKEALQKEKRLSEQGSISIEDAEKILNDYAKKLEDYENTYKKKDEAFTKLRDSYLTELDKMLQKDVKFKKMLAKSGLLFGNVLQNIGATMHNITNPNDWIYAADPITMRMGQNMANTLKNRQKSNDTYIDSQVEYWNGVLPEYIDSSKIKQRMKNATLLNTYKRLDEGSQKMIMALSTSDAWPTISNNSLLTFMDNLQKGGYANPTAMIGGLVSSLMTASDESVDDILGKLKGFMDMIGVDPAQVKKIVSSGTGLLNSTVNAAGSVIDGVGNISNRLSGKGSKNETKTRASVYTK